MHIVLQVIQILLLKKGYVEVKYDRVHNNDDSMNQYSDYGLNESLLHRTEHQKIQNKPIAVVIGLLATLYIRLFALNW